MNSKHHATERHIENELMDSLIIVNETLDRIEKDRKECCLWRKDDYKNYQEIFTNSTMEYLLQKKPNNNFINVFGDGLVTRYWANFKLDGLIYDTTDNIFHIVLFKYYLDEDGLYEIDETLKKFRDFIQQEKPQYRPNLRRWNTFFDDECGVIPNCKKDSITMSVFLGFERVQSRNILSIAGERMITIIEPNTSEKQIYT